MVSHTKVVLEDSTTFHYAGSRQYREECTTDAIDTQEGNTEAVDEKTWQHNYAGHEPSAANTSTVLSKLLGNPWVHIVTRQYEIYAAVMIGEPRILLLTAPHTYYKIPLHIHVHVWAMEFY